MQNNNKYSRILKKFIFINLGIFFIFQNPYSFSQIEQNKQEKDKSIGNKKLDSEIVYKSEYILGPGDKIFIEFDNLEIFSKTYSLDPDGIINLPELDNYVAKNKTIEELKIDLNNKYKRFIIEPNLKIHISYYRPVKFFISGEIKNPGLYELNYSKNIESNDPGKFPNESKLSNRVPRLFDAIKLANGVNNTADLSSIRIKRKNSKSQGGGEIETNINLLTLLFKGSQEQNIRIYDGDYIFIPKSENLIKDQILAINKTNLNPSEIRVYITGNVKESGSFVLPKGSSLIQAISTAGGKKMFTGNIQFMRFNNDGSTIKNNFRYDENARISSYKNPILMEGDIINVQKTILGKTTATISEISNPFLSGYGLYKIFN